MELRELKYFLTVAQEGSFSNAAKVLHVTQPTISRQLAALEAELGRELYTRSHKGMELTDAGIILYKYAENIVALAEKAEEEVMLPAKSVSGSVHIAAGETKVMGVLAQTMVKVRESYPNISFQLYSGTSIDLMENLIRGRYDFLLECELQNHKKLHTMRLPETDKWGVLMRKDSPLGNLKTIRPEDLKGCDVITSRQGLKSGVLHGWVGEYAESYNIVATYSLGLNGKFLVREGLGYMFAYEGLLFDNDSSDLVFVPLSPQLESHQGIVWRQTLPSKQAAVFLDYLRKQCES